MNVMEEFAVVCVVIAVILFYIAYQKWKTNNK